MLNLKKNLSIIALSALALSPLSAEIKLINLGELSGPGATVGTNFKNSAELAIEEINAKGGILGQKITMESWDTKSDPATARGLAQKAIDEKPYALLGPGYSGSVKVTAPLADEAKLAEIMGGEAAELTKQGYKYLFRTAFGQQSSMPNAARMVAENLKIKSIAIMWVNNDFGKGGRDVITAELTKRGVKIVADLSSEAGQADFAADVAKIKAANPEAVFVYLNEDESARALKELRRQDVKAQIVGETTVIGQKVIELAGDAANGVKGHIGLSVDAPIPSMKAYKERFVKKYNYVPDHNGIKGYLAVYMIKAATEKMGKVDRDGLAGALRGLTITADKEPGILMDLTIDENGDLSRQSFIAEVVAGKQVIKEVIAKAK